MDNYQLSAFIWYAAERNNCNTYLLSGPTNILIDPGHLAYFDQVKENLKNVGLGLADIGLVICTHAHPDHVEAVTQFKNTQALFAIHADEYHLLKPMFSKLGYANFNKPDDYLPQVYLTQGDLVLHHTRFNIIVTPGHSPGGICIYWPEQKILFSGDVLFYQGIGRSDLPGGNAKLLKQSIRRLKKLDLKLILPGHGDVISGPEEISNNFTFIENYFFDPM